MSAENTPRRASNAEDSKALCQWERTAAGGLIARWRRGRRASSDTMLYGVGTRRAHWGTDRRHPSVPGRGASERLRPAAVIVAMYVVIGFGLFSVFVAR